MSLELLKGQFCRVLSEGQRIFVESVTPADGLMPARVTGRYIEGPNIGGRLRCFVDSLEPLGYEVPKQDVANLAAAQRND